MVVAAAGVLGTLVTRRLLPAWRGAPFLIAAALGSLGSAVVVSVLVGIPGLFSSWSVTLVMVLLGLVVAFAVPVPDGAGEPGPDRGPVAPVGWFALAALPVSLAAAASLIAAWGRVGTGMTGFDSTWYHGPIAAEFIRTGETLSLHFIAPQFLTWFYPHGSELINAITGSAWGGDLPSLFLNSLFLAGTLVAAWVIARPWGGLAGPVSVAGVALALGCSAAFADQFGEARNDLAGAFFLLSGVALLVGRNRAAGGGVRLALLVGVAAGLAAGTKLNFVPAAVVLVLCPLAVVEAGARMRALGASIAGALLTGGFWYLRNLIQTGNPLPWTAGDGPLGLVLPGPVQETGGRESGSVLGYLFDGRVITDWFIPGLADGFGVLWPIALLIPLAGIALALFRPPAPVVRLGGLVALVGLASWIVGPTSASGPEGEPLGFVSGLRYLVPSLALGFALLGPLVADRRASVGRVVLVAIALLGAVGFPELVSWGRIEVVILLLALSGAGLAVAWKVSGPRESPSLAVSIGGLALGGLALIAVGFGIASKYDRDRYRNPSFTVAGLDRAFAWEGGAGPGAIATTATRSYPFRGVALDRRVEFPGIRVASGGLAEAGSCRAFREVINRGGFRYVVLSLDREGRRRAYPREVRWLSGDPMARLVFREPPTAVFELEGRLDPGGCR